MQNESSHCRIAICGNFQTVATATVMVKQENTWSHPNPETQKILWLNYFFLICPKFIY
ncbi:MAG: hypothetical protein ACFE78_09160 [Candidatus Hodarchaeota archaeon]